MIESEGCKYGGILRWCEHVACKDEFKKVFPDLSEYATEQPGRCCKCGSLTNAYSELRIGEKCECCKEQDAKERTNANRI